MCGSLLSKFGKTNNRVDPAISFFRQEGRVLSITKSAQQDSACYEDRGFWEERVGNGESSTHSLVASSSEGNELSKYDSSSQNEIEAAVRILDRPTLPCTNSKKVRLPVADNYINQERALLEGAREILELQGYIVTRSSSDTVVAQPFSSTKSTLPAKVKPAVAFDISVGNKVTVCSAARLPRILRHRGKVAQELTLQEIREKMRAAEERKLIELQRIRECARSRVGMGKFRPAEISTQDTNDNVTAKLAVEELKQNEEINNQEETRNRLARKRNRIEEAGVFAKTHLESSTEPNTEESNDTEKPARLQETNDIKGKVRFLY